MLGACAWQLLLPLPRAMRYLERAVKRKLQEDVPTPKAARTKRAASAVPKTAERSGSREEEEGARAGADRPALLCDDNEATDEEIIASLLCAMIVP